MRAETLRGDQPSGGGSWEMEASEEATQATYLMFRLGARIFAVDVRSVREVLVVCEILPLPKAPPDVVGVIDLRNQGIAIVDLAARLGMMPEISHDARIIVFEVDDGGSALSIGVVADQVLRVREVPDEDIEPVAKTGADWQGDGVDGVIRTQDGIALILQIEQFLVTTDKVGDFDFG
ncbi:chemotaxis protein CheW [Phaeobacter sp. PT47_59]|uniref:chemotaxis protein CheW n=1 Tax=Phaeobacter sp. PT47_59 TaxID=3029979 RepID=UPI0023808AB2|nr:chemotaxis protein CheW [Phaeobacter sp. PT47_59]MDE4175658.1 chemotaxis protein CheW [Phaeobacter sp. PT47_59]